LSLALAVDRKGILPKILCTNCPSWNIFPSILPSPSSVLFEKDMVDGIKENVWRGRVKRESG